jgi:hypothetical protein
MKNLTALLLLFSMALLVVAQNPSAKSPIEEMVAAERAFAKSLTLRRSCL